MSKVQLGEAVRLFVGFLIACACFTGIPAYAVNSQENNRTLVAAGTVLDAAGDAVPGVSIVQTGTLNGTMTDGEGRFVIKVPHRASLLISCIGYEDKTVGAEESMIIVLEEDSQFLNEVVVVGFGTQKKENLTGAVSSVDVDRAFSGKPVTDISKGLQGTVPGLSVVFNNNDLGASPTMKIRGTGSVKGSASPLILLDGVEIPDLSFINPENIKSISVLKDAASASIYGSRAAWGVILITSKDGSGVKDKACITYSNNFSWNTPSGLPLYITDKEGILAQLEEGIIAQKNVDGSRIEAFGMYYDTLGEGIARWFDNYSGNLGNPVYKYGEDYEFIGSTPYYYRVSDPNKEIFKTSITQTHNLGISGNTGNTNYNIGIAYSDIEGSLKGAKENNVKRNNVNISTNTQLRKWLNIGTKVMYVEKNHTYPYGYAESAGVNGLFYYVMRFPAFFPFGYSDGSKLADGSYADERARTAEGLLFRHGNAYISDESLCTANEQYLTLGANVRINIMNGLSLYADYTRGRDNLERREMRQPYYVANWSFPAKTAMTTDDFLRRTFVNKISNTCNAYLDYHTTFASNHNLSLKSGMNAEDLSFDSQTLMVIGVRNPDLPTLNLTDKKKEAEVDEIKRSRATAGFFGRINYNYKEKYLLELNGRYDGSSSFRPGKQWEFFSSASAGYRISEEKFWTVLKPYVPSLKIRGSYGSVGNQALESWYPYIPLMPTYSTSWLGQDGNKVSGTTTPDAVNKDMTWERIRTFDIGFDASLFNRDLSIVFDCYLRQNMGMLVTGNEYVHYVGIESSPLENGGDLRTRGWELQMDYNHSFHNNLSVYGTFTLSDSRSKIVKWKDNTGALSGWYEGKEIGEIWGFETDRYFASDDFLIDSEGKSHLKPGIPDQNALQSGLFVFGPGDIKYKDLNGDGKIDSGNGTISNHGDLIRIGNALPRYEYSLRLGAVFKGIDFEVLLQGVGKREMWTTSSLFIPHSEGTQMNIFRNQLDYWTPENTDARFPRPYINDSLGSIPGVAGKGVNNFAPQTRYLANLAYLRLKNLTLGYSLPSKILEKIHIEKVRVYFSAQNLLTFDRIGGVMDPELTGGSQATEAQENGVDLRMAGRAVPFNRQLSCGLQVTF